MKKGFIRPTVIALGIVIVLALLGFFYFGKKSTGPSTTIPVVQASPAPDATANWKTYTNKDYHFSFKYPPILTLQEDKKLVFESTDFDGQKITVVSYSPAFTTGKILTGEMLGDPGLQSAQDISWLIINITPTQGKTIMQAYDNKRGFGDNTKTKVTLLDKTGNADEIATVSNIQSHIMTYRKGNYFFDLGHPQNGNVLPDGSDDINKYIDQILPTLKFTN